MFLFIVSNFKAKIKLFKDKKLLFLISINIVPVFLIFLTSLIMGTRIRTMWMTLPFIYFLECFLVYIFQTKINLEKFKKFLFDVFILFIFSPITLLYISSTQIRQKNRLSW